MADLYYYSAEQVRKSLMFSTHAMGGGGFHASQPHMSMLRLRNMMRESGLGQSHRMGLHAIGMGMHPQQAMHMPGMSNPAGGASMLPHLPNIGQIAQAQHGLGVAPVAKLPTLPAPGGKNALGSLRPIGGSGGGILGGL